MKLSDYDYILPPDYIAQYPEEKRDNCRLLVVNRKTKEISHKYFKDILDYLNKGDTLVLNDTKVQAARLFGKRITGGRREILLLERRDKRRFTCLIRPGRYKIGEKIYFSDNGLEAILTARNEIEFNTEDLEKIYRVGKIPLPPYIKRQLEEQDKIRYQTVYAREEGSIASPTAGLHFTKDLLDKIKSKGVNIVYLTVHIGYSTFKTIKCENIAEHKMGEEYFNIPLKTWETIVKSHQHGGRVISVGTSSTRALETVALNPNMLSGKTELFIYPGFSFKVTDCLITNFHLARTTPLMLVAAFMGKDLIKEAYRQAIEAGYRFLSFGDCMLIL
ncbi:MAG: tRNA preQ1(34) S-adenosylmethionine ribosyltransferase-isomerase QueA [Candidatus Omnitrophica bacterium]|nr:tRNA preQ1(34) S-adenosylmethionine ribosyltransferase-isomerase QueA [Candidatus Omnitrophota bacterium]MCM8770517.1 tRNA preQ1(34) S-adenosylmethionine ribosyltransferase-isomerase QueA [Candidatus Omnitrophota bacterium]